jgi:signal peptidase II
VSNAPKKSPPGKDAAASRADEGQDQFTAGSRPGPLPRNRFVVYLAIVVLGCGADLATKHWMFRWRGLPRAGNVWWLIEGRLGIETSVNTGALFGMGAGYWWLFALLSVAAASGIVTWLFVLGAARDRWLNVALASITGGILGNLFDRLGLWDSQGLPPAFAHGVRDWILFVWPEIKLQIFNPWPNFNIADSLLVTGAIMLVVHAVVWREKQDVAKGTGDGAQARGIRSRKSAKAGK